MKKVSSFYISIVLCTLFLSALVASETSQAAQCAAKACIKVYTLDGQLVIEGKKGSGPQKPSRPAVTPRKVIPSTSATRPSGPSKKPTATRTPAKNPRPSTVARPKRSATPPIPKLTPKPKIKKKVTRSTSLSDRLVKLLPLTQISHQPERNALINVPMYFWCDLPSQFNAKVSIVGEVIDVAMRPSFVWSFGDGSLYATISSGAPFPKGGITHTYRRSGRYLVLLVVTWGGLWTFDGVSRAITGEIHQSSISFVDIATAPTVVTK